MPLLDRVERAREHRRRGQHHRHGRPMHACSATTPTAVGLVRDLTHNLRLQRERSPRAAAGRRRRGARGARAAAGGRAERARDRQPHRPSGPRSWRSVRRRRGTVRGSGFEALGSQRFDLIIKATAASLDQSAAAAAGSTRGRHNLLRPGIRGRRHAFARWARRTASRAARRHGHAGRAGRGIVHALARRAPGDRAGARHAGRLSGNVAASAGVIRHAVSHPLCAADCPGADLAGCRPARMALSKARRSAAMPPSCGLRTTISTISTSRTIPSSATRPAFTVTTSELEDYSRARRANVRSGAALLSAALRSAGRRAAVRTRAQAIASCCCRISRSSLLTLQTIRPWQKNPDTYSSGIANSAFVIMERKFAPPSERLRLR